MIRTLFAISILVGSFVVCVSSKVQASRSSAFTTHRGHEVGVAERTVPRSKQPSVPALPQQAAATPSERRAQAYAKLLKGQSYIFELRQGGSRDESLGLARQAFQEAAALDPTLAEAHTLLAEIAFYYPPQDFDVAAREATNATRIDPDNYGAHRLLSRIYSIKSGLRDGKPDRTFVDLAIQELKEVVRLDKNDAEGWALLGEFHKATGRSGAALDAWAHWA